MNQWAVYLLTCSDGTLYCGITNNLTKRIKAHNDGVGAKYTRGRTPVKLFRVFYCATKSEALKLERRIKKASRQQKETFLFDQ
jgi:putative endonuclease